MKNALLATLLLLIAPAYARAPGGIDAPAGADAAFLAARDDFRTGDAAGLDRLYPRLSSTLYEPYVAYYSLHMHLSTENPDDIRKFLARPADTPVIDKLRGEWLKQLANNQQWDAFTDEYPHLVNEDPELLCDSLQARRTVQPRGALIEARRLWTTGEANPEDCMPLFDAALAAGVIGESDVWARIRLALEAGNVTLAKQFATRLPAQYFRFPPMLDQAYANPGRFLSTADLAHAGPAERLAALFALRRLAKQSPDIALARWDKIASYFAEAEQLYFYGWLGYEGARAQDDRALQWYQQAKDAPLAPPQLAWRARAALRALNWREVVTSINAMPPYQRQREAWRYWKGRALEALGWRDQAADLFRGLSSGYGYYGQLAANELAQPGDTPGPHRADPAIVQQVQAQPGIQRALALYRLALYPEAAREWAWAIRDYDDKHLLAASEIAQRNGVYDRSIEAAERTRQLHDFNLRYPAPYRAEMQQPVRDNDLDEAWVYGLMRQESRFALHANSVVGASGLMQIMPATARWVAHKMGLKHYHNALLTELGTNLKLGTYYLKSVLSRLDNNPVLASAAYNAGPSRADQWRDDRRPLEGAIYIETIPFDETRDYVKKVMSNTAYYSRLFGQPAISLKQRLGVIPPRTAGDPAMADER
ncbi:MAG TPA: transglycosylase SLT domain-containing protein [Gallionellaceae bacterium]|nr:transglycosylase SLT domain-containing protein [Gallionellaceae bacterium]